MIDFISIFNDLEPNNKFRLASNQSEKCIKPSDLVQFKGKINEAISLFVHTG